MIGTKAENKRKYSDLKFLDTISHPNFLTMFRIGATPGIVLLMLFPVPICAFLAALLFSLAAITDYLDGYFARTRGLESTFGKIMDPLADKLLVSSSLIMLTSLGWIEGWIVCVIVGREIAITGLRTVMLESGKDVAASPLGKYKTGFQIAAIIPLLIHYEHLTFNFHAVGYVLLIGAVIFTVWSGADYLIKSRKLLV